MLNRLRGRIAVQVDGGLRTGRDVVIGALLGADEFGFATAPLIAAGCIMMRKCHLNTCPVGVATQDPVLRKRFTGKPEHVINYFFFVAEEVREIMAALGFRTLRRDDRPDRRCSTRSKADRATGRRKGLDFSPAVPQAGRAGPTSRSITASAQDHGLDKVLDRKLIERAQARARDAASRCDRDCRSATPTARPAPCCRARSRKRYGHAGLPEDTIHVSFKGTAGQSFGAWLARGVTLELEGEANDYVGKGLSGGTHRHLSAARSRASCREESIIVGNTVLYGAIAGECYFRGVAGERFAVRNSGAIAVVEGMGDHGCEYMTGGVVVVLGQTGRNFAAGMSGGIAYVLDEDGDFEQRCNLAMVELEPVAEEEDARQRLTTRAATSTATAAST